MQASLEAEARGKADALRSKKKLEQDINELEVALDGANRGRADSEKNIKKLQAHIVEVQQVCSTRMRSFTHPVPCCVQCQIYGVRYSCEGVAALAFTLFSSSSGGGGDSFSGSSSNTNVKSHAG